MMVKYCVHYQFGGMIIYLDIYDYMDKDIIDSMKNIGLYEVSFDVWEPIDDDSITKEEIIEKMNDLGFFEFDQSYSDYIEKVCCNK